MTLKGCDCDGVRAFPEEEEPATALAEPTNIPSTDDSADSVTLNREVGLARGSFIRDICMNKEGGRQKKYVAFILYEA